MFVAEMPGTHLKTGEPFVVKYKLLPVSTWSWRRPLKFNKPWLVECLVDFRGTTYHHYEHDFWTITLRAAVSRAMELDEVWWEVRNSPTEEWWV